MSRTPSLRLATADDFRTFYGREPPPVGTWSGYVAERGSQIVGFAVVRGLGGQCWASVDLMERLPPVLMHRTAVLALADLGRRGVRAINVYCDLAIPGAEHWLRRLGFCPSPELTTDPDYPVWSRLVDG